MIIYCCRCNRAVIINAVVIRSSAFTLFLYSVYYTVLVKLEGRLIVVTIPDALINVTFFVFVFFTRKKLEITIP